VAPRGGAGRNVRPREDPWAHSRLVGMTSPKRSIATAILAVAASLALAAPASARAVYGGSGNDTLNGGEGNDDLAGGYDNVVDVLYCGNGWDRVWLRHDDRAYGCASVTWL
jgi:hypothetical protein